MSAHCRLATLLLLLALGHSTAESAPPYLTTKTTGDDLDFSLDDIDLEEDHGSRSGLALGKTEREENFFIPDKQCYGVLHVNEQKPLQCPENTLMTNLRVQVWDYEKTVNIYIGRDLDPVTITREPPCTGTANVEVEVICSDSKKLESRRGFLPFIPIV